MRDRRIVLRLRFGKMIKISDSVTYREYNDQTFIIDTSHHSSFRINAPVRKLLDLFAEGDEPEKAKRKLKQQYPDVDTAVLSNDVDATIDFLIKNRLTSDCESDSFQKTSHTNTRFFQRYTIREKILYSALFELTYRCPEKCVHCYLEPSDLSCEYINKQNEELSYEEIADILDQLADMNVMEITFTGGEPFSRNDIFDILRYANQRRFSINVFSNGILLSENDITELSKLRINCFHSSVYSHIPEKHDSITGVKGSFHRTIHTLRELSQKGVYVNFKFVLMEQNKDDFFEVVELAKSMGATVQLISSISPSTTGNCSITKLGIGSDDDLRKALKYWNEISDFQSYAGEYSADDPICEAGRNSISINPYGIVTPCNAFHYEIGNTRHNSIYDIWNGSKELRYWQSLSKDDLLECRGCKYISCCSFCPGNAINHSGDMLKKYDEACRQAKIQFDLRKHFDK